MSGGVTGAMGVDRVMALRAQIVERNQALARAQQANGAAPATQAEGATSFTDVFEGAVKNVNEAQAKAGELSAAYERGETVDIAQVMLARQEASVGFEATMQVRNKLLSAYKDIMSMPV
ncbi:flagellar hook-basal body complex protein FliE [Stakelama tenebrarum]|uniref:Flagellar hook-basal body complex protein FliE n=1 Tax=Stakelama tenebrarum TaxID=2711215 RepID=A0A6G6Y1E4_9SPHN|nr:flagellar hook-basal body complex protein FliE [Sphingosinithalassobacter tenebrarum]QIG78719.1 flagellar hook-basal body complex protein FliE [Sphingosinithalassobacter tenebrarum]